MSVHNHRHGKEMDGESHLFPTKSIINCGVNTGIFLLVSKMDSLSDCTESESLAKRPKLDLGGSENRVLCNGGGFTGDGAAADGAIAQEAAGTLSGDVTAAPAFHAPPYDFDIPDCAQDDLLPDMSQDSLELEGDDDNASTSSHLSEISGLSDLSGKDWKPMAGSMVWIQKQMQSGVDPRMLLNDLGAGSEQIPQYVDDITLWKLIINMLSEPPRRHKLRHVNTLDDVVRLLKGAKNIVVLTGAGVSVSCGIPDFRSRDGIYLRLAVDFPDLPDPQAMFDINYFGQDPRPFYKFAKDIYPGNFQPSPCHRFIKLLERHEKLLRNYTQNIDTLEKVADIDKVVECHGSFATATCTKCSHRVTADAIREPILSQKIPLCEKCHGEGRTFVSPDDIEAEELSGLVGSGIMKPDIVFFGEGLPDVFHEAMAEDKAHCDLLLVIGSSLKVRPVALIPSSLPSEVPQILINREPLPHCHFDVELLGDCDIIVNYICQQMGNPWEEGVYLQETLQETLHLLPETQRYLDRPICSQQASTESKSIDQKCCHCIFSTTPQSDPETPCSCPLETEQQQSISILNGGLVEPQSVKERHISIDSARDSGIGENSNFTDTEKFDEIESRESTTNEPPDWSLKIKKNMADRLPANSFYLVAPSRYIFPGAEIFYDPAEKYSYLDDMSSSDSSDSESEND